jgi:hypothetical protein
VERLAAVALMDRLHQAQNLHYGGGDDGPLRRLLAADITWIVPGDNRIAGTYRGIDEVFSYFRMRRDIAAGTFRIHQKDVLAGAGDQIAALADGTALISGRERHWSTVGLYRVTPQRTIAACWLLPLDPAEFDVIWSASNDQKEASG